MSVEIDIQCHDNRDYNLKDCVFLEIKRKVIISHCACVDYPDG